MYKLLATEPTKSMSNLRRGNPAWKKGVSGNPQGRARVNPELLPFAELTNEEIRRIIGKYSKMSKRELDDVIAEPTTKVLDLAICTAFSRSIDEGDTQRLEFLFNRSVGKVRDQIDFNVQVQKIPNTELIERYESILQRAKQVTIEAEATEVKNELGNVDSPSDIGDPSNSAVNKRDNHSD